MGPGLLIADIFANAARAVPGRVAVALGDRTLTYGELDADANRVAYALAGLGVRRGDRVVTWSDNSIEHAVVFAALAKLGAAFAPANARLGPDEATEMTWLVGAGGSRRALGDLPDVLTVRAVGGQGDEAPDPDAVDTLAEFDRRVALVGSTSYVVAPVQTGDVSTDPSFVLVVRDDERSWTPLELASIRTVAEIARVSIRSCGAI